MVYHANKISPQKILNLGLILDTHHDTIWTVKDDTDGTPQGTPPTISENAICRTCTNSVVEELRTPHIANATGNGFTTEWQDDRENQKKKPLDNGYTTCYNVGTVNERKEVIPLRMKD